LCHVLSVSRRLQLYPPFSFYLYFFCNEPATPASYTLSLHDALPISGAHQDGLAHLRLDRVIVRRARMGLPRCRLLEPGLDRAGRSEEHTSELQSRENLVCRLLLEKKKEKQNSLISY